MMLLVLFDYLLVEGLRGTSLLTRHKPCLLSFKYALGVVFSIFSMYHVLFPLDVPCGRSRGQPIYSPLRSIRRVEAIYGRYFEPNPNPLDPRTHPIHADGVGHQPSLSAPSGGLRVKVDGGDPPPSILSMTNFGLGKSPRHAQ